jgi:hypothetical protein
MLWPSGLKAKKMQNYRLLPMPVRGYGQEYLTNATWVIIFANLGGAFLIGASAREE